MRDSAVNGGDWERSRRLAEMLVVGVLVSQTGCRQSSPGPCVLDVLGCGPPGVFELDPSCQLDGPLAVILGDGVIDLFTPLSLEVEPELHYGSQGGQHYVLGVRVDNPNPSVPGLEIRFVVRGATECALDAEDCAEWVTFAERTAVVDDEALFQTTPEGAVVSAGYVVVLDEHPYQWAGAVDTRVQIIAEVRDRCDRRGAAGYDFIATGHTHETGYY